MNLTVEVVRSGLEEGSYIAKDHDGYPKAGGKFYRCIQDIFAADKTDRLKEFYFCKICHEVIYVRGGTSNGSARLLRHANKCDPIGRYTFLSLFHQNLFLCFTIFFFYSLKLAVAQKMTKSTK